MAQKARAVKDQTIKVTHTLVMHDSPAAGAIRFCRILARQALCQLPFLWKTVSALTWILWHGVMSKPLHALLLARWPSISNLSIRVSCMKS